MDRMTINCHNLETFTSVCASLVRESLPFTAETCEEGFTIYLQQLSY